LAEGHFGFYFSTNVIVGLELALLMSTSLLPEIRIAVVPLPITVRREGVGEIETLFRWDRCWARLD